MAYYIASEYSTYLTAIKGELSEYGSRLAEMYQLGHKPSADKEVKFMLLSAFVEIAEWYLGEYDDPDNNAFTIAEFNNIQDHINKICNSEHFILIE